MKELKSIQSIHLRNAYIDSCIYGLYKVILHQDFLKTSYSILRATVFGGGTFLSRAPTPSSV